MIVIIQIGQMKLKGTKKMDITFLNNHIKTICELQALAEKHNCSIQIGTRNNTQHPDDFEIDDDLKERYESIKILDENNITIDRGIHDEYSIWFELVDKRGEKTSYHVLTYTSHSGYIDFDEEEVELLPESVKDEFYVEYGGNTLYFDYCKTKVYGFENVKYKPNVYRSGIALREFSWLVCDYLGEPRINRNY